MAATPHFAENELACHCCGRNGMDRYFLTLLERIRLAYGKPMRLSSAYRCPKHDAKFGGHGRHSTGRAVDVLVFGADARELVLIALGFGITCIGIWQRGDHGKRFLHLDNLTAADGFPSPTIWSY